MVTQRPSFIPIPPPQFSLHITDDDDGELSPSLQFHTAPSTPDLPSPSQFFYTPPSSPLPDVPTSSQDNSLSPSHHYPTDDDYIPSVDLAIDLALNDEGLSTLEKIYLFSRSKAAFHRVFIAHALPSYLDEVTPQEANEYVLPLLTGLAMDDEEQVKEALAAELVPIIWWFFTHCQVIPDDPITGAVHAYHNVPAVTAVTISVQAFTPILGTLLLSSNPHVGSAARYAVVELLSRMRKADKDATILLEEYTSTTNTTDDDESELVVGLFGPQERAMFQDEIFQQVVIGMGRLDVDTDYPANQDVTVSQWNGGFSAASEKDFVVGGNDQLEAPDYSSSKENINPYFPLISVPSPDSSTASSSNSPESSDSHSSSNSPDDSTSNGWFFPTGYAPVLSDLPSNHIDSPSSKSVNQTMPHNEYSSTSFESHYTRPRRTPSPDSFFGFENRSVSSSVQVVLNPPKSGRLSPELIESPSPHSVGERVPYNKSDVECDSIHDRIFGPYWNCICDHGVDEYAEGEDEKAAVGRLSSMSLMAAVTASGSLGDETKEAFVKEVERVGRDPVPWVRTEASFALGALAKVVPEELVQCSLLPLFDYLRWDSAWRVRHSAVFALPAILSRLRPHERRKLALETVFGLATDESATVRLGVLEVLGEVLYTFHDDQEGIPEDLLNLFLGNKGDEKLPRGLRPPTLRDHLLEEFLQDPNRPLICAFNYPAVALAVGKERWKVLRESYLSLAAISDFKVRRTLAASLGELAKIIGEENAEQDLISVWWGAVSSSEEEVRLKALEVAETFATSLSRHAGSSVIQGILTLWDNGAFRTWRERDCVSKSLVKLACGFGQEIPFIIHSLLKRALEDNVAAVRESAITAFPSIRNLFITQPHALSELRIHLRSLAFADTYRKRMTFIACQQALITSDGDFDVDDISLDTLAKLANDSVEGVRIGMARLVGIMCDRFMEGAVPISGTLLKIVQRLSRDNSHDVQSYVPDLSEFNHIHQHAPNIKKRISDVYTFSRPPPSRAARKPVIDVVSEIDDIRSSKR
ncbi:hypothetical protein AX17_003413 [Amanita inopinata Kibby_2008]|nr:hypothetical protein AX17_003413 [Amanita inopinata Kibby_2008]